MNIYSTLTAVSECLSCPHSMCAQVSFLLSHLGLHFPRGDPASAKMPLNTWSPPNKITFLKTELNRFLYTLITHNIIISFLLDRAKNKNKNKLPSFQVLIEVQIRSYTFKCTSLKGYIWGEPSGWYDTDIKNRGRA